MFTYDAGTDNFKYSVLFSTLSGCKPFKDTLNSNDEGIPFVDYLWLTKWIVAFLKIDDGPIQLIDRLQLMHPMKDLYSTLRVANSKMNL
jgi:fructose-bisphosphate aldolase class 1